MIIDLTVEVPRGSRNEYSIDRETGRVHLKRTLLTDMVYPADSGYLDYTLGPNGGPLNALLLLEEPTYPGVAVTVRPVGLLRMHSTRDTEERIITVPAQDPRWSTTLEITDLSEHTRHSLQHFFQHYTDLESGPVVTVDGFGSRDEAERLVTTALNAFRSRDRSEY
ncbi:MAG: inorganic diphosphatase [Cryobacterium sp.]